MNQPGLEQSSSITTIVFLLVCIVLFVVVPIIKLAKKKGIYPIVAGGLVAFATLIFTVLNINAYSQTSDASETSLLWIILIALLPMAWGGFILINGAIIQSRKRHVAIED